MFFLAPLFAFPFIVVLGLELRAFILSHSTRPMFCDRAFWDSLVIYLPGLALNCHPPDLCLVNSWTTGMSHLHLALCTSSVCPFFPFNSMFYNYIYCYFCLFVPFCFLRQGLLVKPKLASNPQWSHLSLLHPWNAV
jgi:hypothetical protein